jgi:hypothetical protein
MLKVGLSRFMGIQAKLTIYFILSRLLVDEILHFIFSELIRP